MATPPSYVYRPLPEGWIRLLKLTTGQGDQFRCSLLATPLGDTDYAALSYTWGDPLYRELSGDESQATPMSSTTDFQILTDDGSCLYASENLLDALVQLCRTGHDANGKDDQNSSRSSAIGSYIWVDAVCINQDDKYEKDQQMAMMDRIYGKASVVIIWLGKQDEHTDGALEVLGSLASTASSIPTRGPIQAESITDDEVCTALGISHILSPDWLDYAAFLRRTWFSRIWVVQESFFAARRIVLCGDSELSWEEIEAGVRLLRAWHLDSLLNEHVMSALDPRSLAFIGDPTSDMYRWSNNRLNNIGIFDMLSQMREERLSLSRLLFFSRYFDATNARDKVFAIISLWRGGSDEEKSSLPHTGVINIDHTQSVAELYAKATFVAIWEAGNLSLLSLAGGDALCKTTSFPSWVPNYGRGPHITPLETRFSLSAENCHTWSVSRGLEWPGLPISALLGNDPRTIPKVLPVRGFRFDTIAALGPTYREVDGADFNMLSLLDILAEYPRELYPNNTSPCDAFWRTSIRDRFQGHRLAPGTPTHRTDARRAFPAFIMQRVRELRQEIRNREERLRDYDGYEKPPKQQAFNRLCALRAETERRLQDISGKYADDAAFPSLEQLAAMIKVADGGRCPEERALERDRRCIETEIKRSYFGRRLARTRKGYFGLVPQRTVLGDEAWILAGGDVPFILRQGGLYEFDEEGRTIVSLVGVAFVFGIMDGEAVVENDNQNILDVFFS